MRLNLSSTARWAENAVTVAGAANGAAGSSLDQLQLNFNIFFDENDILYIADYWNARVVLIGSNSTTAIRVIGQEFPVNMFTFNGPGDVFVTSTSIYVMDTWNYRVQKWTRSFSDPVTVAGLCGVSGSSTNMQAFSHAFNLFVDIYGNLFVSDFPNHRVMMFPSNSRSGTSGVIVAGTGNTGSLSNQLNEPCGIFVTDDRALYIADSINHRIQKWIIGATSGITVAGIGTAGNAASQLNYPTNILIDLNGYMYITAFHGHRVVRWALGSNFGECIAACTGHWGIGSNQLTNPTGLAFDSSGSLYVSDYTNSRVQKFQILDESSILSIC